ncbi:MAG: hypothetical protein IKI67_06500 [Bacteroidales bacterium]|nr:hypothetical protein [Bacteroidales bacterium]
MGNNMKAHLKLCGLNLLAALVSTLLIASCTKDDSSASNALNSKNNISFRLSTSSEDGVVTKSSPSTAEEHLLKLADIGEFYVSVSGNSGSPAANSGLSDTHSGGVSNFMEQSSDTRYSGNFYSNGSSRYERLDWIIGDAITIVSDAAISNAEYTTNSSNFSSISESSDIDKLPYAKYTVSSVVAGTGSNEYKSYAKIEPSKEAPFSGNGLQWGSTSTHRFLSFYPSIGTDQSIYHGAGMINSSSELYIQLGLKYPSSQKVKYLSSRTTSNYYEADMSYAYMYAGCKATVSSSVELSFKPAFTSFEFCLVKPATTSEIKVKKVTLSSIDSYLSVSDYVSANIILPSSGEAYLQLNSSDPSSMAKSIEVSFCDAGGTVISDGVPLSETKPLEFTVLALPKDLTSVYITLDLDIAGNSVQRQLDLRRNESGAPNASEWLTIPAFSKVRITNLLIPKSISKGLVQKEFSVSPSKRVYFSPGNLQALPNGLGSASAWRFAANQYDYVGSDFDYSSTSGDNGFSSSNTHWMDLFAWSGEDNSSNTMWGIGNSSINRDYSGTFKDWGTNPDLVNTLGSGWETLTMAEWRYILGNANVEPNGADPSAIQSMPCRTDANIKRALATVGNVRGLIILPDDWTLPRNCKFTPTLSSYTVNTYSLLGAPGRCGSWIAMEQAGALFLPAAGLRGGDPTKVLQLNAWVTNICSDMKSYSHGNTYNSQSFNIWNVYVNTIGYNDFGLGDNTGSFNNGVPWAARSVRLVRLELP